MEAMRVYMLCMVTLVYIVNPTVKARALLEANDDDLDGYYWRDYTDNVVPKDALEGGRNSNGHPTYIGQVLHIDQLIPAKIDPEARRVYYEWGYKEYEASQNIKILCTKHPEQFEWVDTGNSHIKNIQDKHFLIGGYEAGAKIYIGRKQLKKELSIGKVISTEVQTTLNTTEDGIGIQHADFQVLSYNPKVSPEKKKKHDSDDHPSTINVKMDEITGANADSEYKQKTLIVNIFT